MPFLAMRSSVRARSGLRKVSPGKGALPFGRYTREDSGSAEMISAVRCHVCAVTSATGKPSVAHSIAEARASPRVRVPYRVRQLNSPSNAPGTVTLRGPLIGTAFTPPDRNLSADADAGERPLPFSATNFCSRAMYIIAKQSPPRPVDIGSVTVSTAVAATAASIAFPPRLRTLIAVSTARGWLEAAIAFLLVTTERREGKARSENLTCKAPYFPSIENAKSLLFALPTPARRKPDPTYNTPLATVGPPAIAPPVSNSQSMSPVFAL